MSYCVWCIKKVYGNGAEVAFENKILKPAHLAINPWLKWRKHRTRNRSRSLYTMTCRQPQILSVSVQFYQTQYTCTRAISIIFKLEKLSLIKTREKIDFSRRHRRNTWFSGLSHVYYLEFDHNWKTALHNHNES